MITRELDAQVAEKVMGGFVANPDKMADVGEIWYWMHKKDGVLCGMPYTFDSMNGMWDHQWHKWEPSTDMTMAWQIVEYLRAQGWRVSLSELADGLWNCRFCPEDTSAYVFDVAPTATLAICGAALKVPQIV
jgi:hypothetical protein